jgi:hypothetical protein
VKLPRNSRLAHAAIHYSTNHEASTFRGQRSILVGVHSVLRESLGLTTSAFTAGAEWTTS